MTEFQKKIYNDHLRVSRQARSLAWKPRQDFSKIEDTSVSHYCAKLEALFHKFPQINTDTFFNAPYVLYPDVKFFGLDFFVTQRAINAYALYNKQKEEESPDNPDQIKFILESVRFIAKFCKENRLLLTDYINFKIGISYAFCIHYKDKRVSIYSLLNFSNFEKNVYSLQPDERELFFNTPNPDFSKYKIRFQLSSKAKPMFLTAYTRINNYLKTLLNSI